MKFLAYNPEQGYLLPPSVRDNADVVIDGLAAISSHGHRNRRAGLPRYGENHWYLVAGCHAVGNNGVHLVQSCEARCQSGEQYLCWHASNRDRNRVHSSGKRR